MPGASCAQVHGTNNAKEVPALGQKQGDLDLSAGFPGPPDEQQPLWSQIALWSEPRAEPQGRWGNSGAHLTPLRIHDTV